MAGQARRAQECRRVSPAESSLPGWEGPGRWGPWLTPAHPYWGLGEGPGCRSRPPPLPTCTPAPCPAERPWPSVAHWLRPCSATLPGPADAGPGLEASSLEFRSCTQAALCLCLGETKMTGSGMPSPELGPAHSRQREQGWGCGWGWILPGSPPQGARRPAPKLPSPLHSPRWDVWNLPPARRGGQCCSPQPGQGVGTGLQLPTGQTCRTCRTLLRSVGLTGPQQQQEQSHGWHLPHGLGLAGVPAGQETAVAGVASARARRSGLHEVGYMLQMSVSSAMLLDLSAWPAQFLSTGRRHPRTLVPP